jgi:hypothetical protein
MAERLRHACGYALADKGLTTSFSRPAITTQLRGSNGTAGRVSVIFTRWLCRKPPGPFALSDETKLEALASEAGRMPGAVVDVLCLWVYPDLETALRGMLSAGPAERAIRASSFERAREASRCRN